MYQTNQTNMSLDFETLNTESFISVENMSNNIEMMQPLDPVMFESEEPIEISSLNEVNITPNIQESMKPSPSSYDQVQKSKAAIPPMSAKSKGFDVSTGANRQLADKGKRSAPRFGTETRTRDVGSIPEWRRKYI
tara:strand:+ start:2246 stop:2650 length:405 start_codon:yes stop_codon:yes gene_type:complete